MVVVDILSSLYKIGSLLHSRVQLVKANKSQCKRLDDRVQIIVDSIKGLLSKDKETASRGDDQSFARSLQHLSAVIGDCVDFISEFSSEKQWYRKVMKAGTAEEKFGKLNEELEDAMDNLHLGIHIQMVADREQDRRDREEDLQCIREMEEQIIQLNLQANEQLADINIKVDEHKEAITKEIRSLREHLDETLKGKQSYSPSDPLGLRHFLIPYSELGFDEVLLDRRGVKLYTGKWSGQRVVIKAIESGKEEDDGFAQEEMKRSLQILSRLHHSCVLNLQGVCLEKSRTFVVTEYMDMGTMEDALFPSMGTPKCVVPMKTPFSVSQRYSLVLQVCQGLTYLHSRDIIHRALNLDCIFLNSKMEAKIGGMKVSKLSSESVKTANPLGVMVAAHSNVAYQAPEAFDRGHQYTTKDDAYSFGMVAWTIITGKKPYADLTIAADGKPSEIIRIVREGYREPMEEKLFPPLLRDMITSCTQGDRNRRAHVKDFVKPLEDFLEQHRRQSDGEDEYKMGQGYEMKGKMKEAFECYQSSFEKGYYKAGASLGFFHLVGKLGVVQQDKEMAHKEFLSSANKGYARAMVNVGKMLENGDGIEKDVAEAYQWYRKAAELGDQTAKAKVNAAKAKHSK